MLDSDADFDKRYDGALLVASALADLADLRSIFFKRNGE